MTVSLTLQSSSEFELQEMTMVGVYLLKNRVTHFCNKEEKCERANEKYKSSVTAPEMEKLQKFEKGMEMTESQKKMEKQDKITDPQSSISESKVNNRKIKKREKNKRKKGKKK